MKSMIASTALAGGRALTLVAVSGTLLVSVMLARADTDALPLRQLRDPFERPAGTAPAKRASGAATAASGAATALDTAPVAESPPWLPQLRAIMYEQERGASLVNISGAVLAVGESVRGYRVVKINERSVVVAKDGARLTLTMDNRDIPQ
jgi:hypothetical protein